MILWYAIYNHNSNFNYNVIKTKSKMLHQMSFDVIQDKVQNKDNVSPIKTKDLVKSSVLFGDTLNLYDNCCCTI